MPLSLLQYLDGVSQRALFQGWIIHLVKKAYRKRVVKKMGEAFIPV
jgi:hypothetical protein